MRKGWMKRLFACMLMLSITAGQNIITFADDGDAAIIIGGETVFEVEAGKTEKIRLQLKNRGSGTAEKVYVEPRVTSGLSPVRVKAEVGGHAGAAEDEGILREKLLHGFGKRRAHRNAFNGFTLCQSV